MATTNVTFTNGSFNFENEAVKVSGTVNINADMLINSLNGTVTWNGANIGTIEARRDMPESWGKLRFIIGYDDPSKASTLVEAANDVIADVQAKLNK